MFVGQSGCFGQGEFGGGAWVGCEEDLGEDCEEVSADLFSLVFFRMGLMWVLGGGGVVMGR